MLKVLHDRILIDPIVESQTQSGLFIPATAAAQIQPNRGTVVGVGTGRMLTDGTIIPLEIKVGDIVIFPQYVGGTISDGAKQYVVLRESDIVAIDQATH
jgi:chaperonin GroES